MENMIKAIDHQVQFASTKEQIQKCWKVMRELRPHLDESSFVPTVLEMISEGYQLAFIEENGIAVSAIGFRYLQFLYNGKHIYIDDLTTLPEHRGNGYAGCLLDFVSRTAKEKGYKQVTLDSGYQRHNAHRLYLNNGFVMSSHHFSKELS